MRAVVAACMCVTAPVLSRALVGREADALFDGELAAQESLARTVASAASHLASESFHTGSARFDGEWSLVSSQMTALGLAQVIAAHPETRARYTPAVRAAIDAMLAPRTWRFAVEAWGSGPVEDLASDHGHAYLGYAALGLGALREVDPSTPHAALHDRIVEALARRLERSPAGVIETYPGEAYPCDIASVVGAIGQHARLTGAHREALIARMAAVFRARWTHHASGYLAQSVSADDGRALGEPRGSGTALAAYFWSFADRSMARSLSDAVAHTGHTTFLGFGGVREYAPGFTGRGDIDSGPVLLGVSVSATGFALSSARQSGDRERYHALFRTASLFGMPVSRDGGWRFASGGAFGNALLFAMLTARVP